MKISKPILQAQRGFSLIELVTAMVIMSLLISISIPNFLGAINHAKVANVKTNMHIFQTIVETYAGEWDGYASTVTMLQYEASQVGRDYWTELSNPFTSLQGGGVAYANASLVALTPAGVVSPDLGNAGLVLYESPTLPNYKYFIYGLDSVGNTVFDNGQVFTLSNS